MLEATHSAWLVIGSYLVAVLAGFTGLSLTRGASALPIARRKTVVALAAIFLGGGVWSMHFIAMLGLRLSILFYYDAAITLLSALVAILIVGLALLILHFRERTPVTLTLAGLVVGLGIAAMHYIGMSGMEICRPVYTPRGVALAAAASVTLSVLAIWVAYGGRTHRNIMLGALCFSAAVFGAHFAAMAGTSFITVEVAGAAAILSNQALAIIVMLSAFLICGAALLTGVTFFADATASPTDAAADPPADAPAPPRAEHPVPYEKNGRTLFVEPSAIAAIRAEGHYSVLYVASERLFCPWSISEAAKRLAGGPFVRTHRSYLVNPAHVTGFERLKDNGVCYFGDAKALEKAPVSRSRLAEVREALGV